MPRQVSASLVSEFGLAFEPQLLPLTSTFIVEYFRSSSVTMNSEFLERLIAQRSGGGLGRCEAYHLSRLESLQSDCSGCFQADREAYQNVRIVKYRIILSVHKPAVYLLEMSLSKEPNLKGCEHILLRTR